MSNNTSNQNVLKNHLNIRRIAIAGVLAALTVVLGLYLPQLAFILVPGLSVQITIMHIPVIIGAILEGPVVGAFIGLIFGLTSLYTATFTPLPIAFAFLNPLVSVLPRILIGIVSYYVYKGTMKIMKGKETGFSAGVASVAGTLTNTIGVLGMIYILYAKRFLEALGIDLPPFIGVFGLAMPNAPLELLAAVLLVTPVVVAVKRARREI